MQHPSRLTAGLGGMSLRYQLPPTPLHPSPLPSCTSAIVCCRALQIAELELHAVRFEEQQAAEDARITAATPGSPATIYKLAA